MTITHSECTSQLLKILTQTITSFVDDDNHWTSDNGISGVVILMAYLKLLDKLIAELKINDITSAIVILNEIENRYCKNKITDIINHPITPIISHRLVREK